MIFEDAHWIDPSSREMLDTIIERVASLPVLLVITFRPEFHPPWTGQAHVATLNLSRLGRREGAALAGSVAGNFPTTVEAEPEVIAHRSMCSPRRLSQPHDNGERAGDRAAARSAYIEATAHFRAALEQADRLPQKDERGRRALTLLLKLGPAIALTIGEWKPEVEAVYRRARDLGREVDDGPKLFRATWGLWLYTSRTAGRPGSGRKN